MRILTLKTIICRSCGESHEAKRSDALCPTCRLRRKREIDNLQHRISTDLIRGLWRCLCGQPKMRKSRRCLRCYRKSQKGEGNPNWKGGRTVNQGYVYIRLPRPDSKSPWIAEHQLVWEKAHGPLPKGWIVHHLNGNRQDNREANLAAMPRKRHSPAKMLEPYIWRIQQLEKELQVNRRLYG